MTSYNIDEYSPVIAQGPIAQLIEYCDSKDPLVGPERLEAYTRCNASKGGFVKSFADKTKAFQSAAAFAEGTGGVLNDTQTAFNAVQETFAKVKIAYGRLEILLSYMQTYQPPSTSTAQGDVDVRDKVLKYEKEWTETYQNCFDIYVDLTSRLETKMSARTPAPTPPMAGNGGGGGNGGANTKLAAELKPDKLSFQHTPVAFAQWTEQFRAFVTDARIDQKEPKLQHAYLASSLEPEVYSAIRYDITDAMQLWDDEDELADTCLSLLTKKFLEYHPMTTRRFNFFMFRQRERQDFPQFLAEMRALAIQCDLAAFTQEDILIYRIMTGLGDKALKKLLHQVPPDELTMAKIEQIGSNYTASKAEDRVVSADVSRKLSLHQKETEKKQKEKGKGSKGKGTQGSKSGQNPASSSPIGFDGQQKKKALAQAGKCLTCARDQHPKGVVCYAKELICSHCQIKGHTKRACFRSGLKQLESKEKSAPSKSQLIQHICQAVSQITPKNSTKKENSCLKCAMEEIPNLRRHLARMSTRRETTQLMKFTKANGNSFYFDVKPDTGSSKSLIAYNLAKKFKLRLEPADDHQLLNASGLDMDVSGKTTLATTFNRKSCDFEYLITKDLHNSILMSEGDCEDIGSVIIVPNESDDSDRNAAVIRSTTLSNKTENFQSLDREDKMQLPTTTLSNKTENFQSLDREDRMLLWDVNFCKKDENMVRLVDQIHEKEILNLKERFKDVLSNIISDKPMEGPEMHINLKPGDKPVHHNVPRQIPLHLRDLADKTIQEFINKKIIEPVPLSEPSDFCHIAFFVPKPNGKVRLVCDLSGLNRQIQRPVHPFLSSHSILKEIDPNAKFFAKLDAVHGYYQISMDMPSRKLCTFILPQGRFRFCRAPMGLSASSDEWCARSDEALKGIPGCLKLVDDVLVSGTNMPELLQRIEMVLNQCRKFNITLSRDKLEIGSKVHFAGFEVSNKGVRPLPALVDSIRNFPAPTNVSELRSFLGLVQQLTEYVPDMSHVLVPLRELLKKNTPWIWCHAQQQAFEQTIQILTGPLLVKFFDPNLKTTLVTDASRKALGFCLLQYSKDSNGKSQPRLIQCGSRSLIPAETRYAVTELETLAIYWAIKKCKYFLYGIDKFEILTDHQPLNGLFKKAICDIPNDRVARWREQLQSYNFELSWVPGKNHLIADALSRVPYFQGDNKDPVERTISKCQVTKWEHLHKDPTNVAIIKAARKDKEYQSVIKDLDKFKKGKDIPKTHPARRYSSVWNDLSSYEGILFKDCNRMVIPHACRKDLLKALHESHPGITRMSATARASYWWIGMGNEIQQLVQNCSECLKYSPSQKPATFSTSREVPEGPTFEVSIDQFYLDQYDYIAYCDRFSGFPLIERLGDKRRNKTKSSDIIEVLEKWFYTYGFPAIVQTDNAANLNSREMADFYQKHGIKHISSAPRHPESNGLIEKSLGDQKVLLQKLGHNLEKYKAAHYNWINTACSSTEGGITPAQMFFARKLRQNMPTVPGYCKLDCIAAENGARDRYNCVQKRSPSNTQYRELKIGERVMFQGDRKTWENTGIITRRYDGGHSYYIQADDLWGGGEKRRARVQIKPLMNNPPSSDSSSSDSSTSSSGSSSSSSESSSDSSDSCSSSCKRLKNKKKNKQKSPDLDMPILEKEGQSSDDSAEDKEKHSKNARPGSKRVNKRIDYFSDSSSDPEASPRPGPSKKRK